MPASSKASSSSSSSSSSSKSSASANKFLNWNPCTQNQFPLFPRLIIVEGGLGTSFKKEWSGRHLPTSHSRGQNAALCLKRAPPSRDGSKNDALLTLKLDRKFPTGDSLSVGVSSRLGSLPGSEPGFLLMKKWGMQAQWTIPVTPSIFNRRLRLPQSQIQVIGGFEHSAGTSSSTSSPTKSSTTKRPLRFFSSLAWTGTLAHKRASLRVSHFLNNVFF